MFEKKNSLLNFTLLSPVFILCYADLSICTMLKRRVNEVLSELGLLKNQKNFETVPCVSVVLHHLLKELPIEVVSSNVVNILHLIEFNKDTSFHQVCICNFYHALNTYSTHCEVIYHIPATYFVSVSPICTFNVLFGNTAPELQIAWVQAI